ncbi:MAG: hypothetical protein ACYCZO_08020 [Daejeonella sp.]
MLILFIGPYYNVYAQKDKVFKAYLSELNLSYIAQEGFTDLDSMKSIIPGAHLHCLIFYSIENNNSLGIGFELIPLREQFADPSTQSKSYLNGIKYYTDTTYNKVKYLGKKDLRKLNAESAAVFDLKTDPEFYKYKYKKCKVMSLFKKDKGIANVYYFYNDSTEINVLRLINDTRDILKFKREKYFNPKIFHK